MAKEWVQKFGFLTGQASGSSGVASDRSMMHGDYGREATSTPCFFDHAGTDRSTAIAWALSAPSVGKGVGRRFF